MVWTAQEFLAAWREVEERSHALEGPSLADRLAMRELEEPGFLESALEDPELVRTIAYAPEFWLRPKQRLPRTAWRLLLYVAGRGSGKTLLASHWLWDRIEAGEAREVALVGPSEGDVRQYMLGGFKRRADGVPGGSGFFDILPPHVRVEEQKEEGLIILPDYGCTLRIHSAEVPEYRGPNPDTVWGDELIKWRYARRLLSNLRLACRSLGRDMPRLLLTTSPKRGALILHELVMDEDCLVITGATDENQGNVDETWLRSETRRLGSSEEASEELGGKVLLDHDGALFALSIIDAQRCEDPSEALGLDRIVVGIDPAGSRGRTSDMCGIVCAGLRGDRESGELFVLADYSNRYSPEGWAHAAFDALEKHGASAFVCERNHFADYVSANLRAIAWHRGYLPVERKRGGKVVGIDLQHRITGKRVEIIEVLAMGDKATRAAPLSTLYTEKRAHHVGRLPELEDEMTTWDPSQPGRSPNRLDALVHAATELFAWDRPPEHVVPVQDAAGMNDRIERRVERRTSFIVDIVNDRDGRGLSGAGRRDRGL